MTEDDKVLRIGTEPFNLNRPWLMSGEVSNAEIEPRKRRRLWDRIKDAWAVLLDRDMDY